MALPVILFNSSTGSDTAASGAGPATALHGTSNASTNSGGTVVTLGGSPNLSGVATDGSAALWLATASGRQWSAISAVDNTAKTVTVTTAYTGSLASQSWAIGGKRKTLASSVKILTDILPGWAVELGSGYTESTNTAFSTVAAGTQLLPIELRGEDGAAARPVLTLGSTIGSTGITLILSANNWKVIGIDFNSDYAALSTDVLRAIYINPQVSGIEIADCRFLETGSGGMNMGVFMDAGGSGTCSTLSLVNCVFDMPTYATSGGIFGGSSGGAFGPPYEGIVRIYGCVFANIPASAVNIRQLTPISSWITDCLFYDNLLGINLGLTLDNPSTNNRGGWLIRNNTIVGSSLHGIHLDGSSNSWMNLSCLNNILANNGGYGINVTASAVPGRFAVSEYVCGGNWFYNNTSGTSVDPAFLRGATTGVDPQFRDAANGDYAPGAIAVGKGAPTWNIGAVRSYTTPGAIQRKAAAVRRGILTGGRM